MRDVFICHASEDKTTVVRPLTKALTEQGISCWLDEAEIKWGDSITKKVNEGLSKSPFVVVVLSQAFLSKNWPERELNAALNIEASSGEVKVLPLIFGDKKTQRDIFTRYPLLNDKSYLTWDGKVEPIIEALKKQLSHIEKSDSDLKSQDKLHTQSTTVYIPRVKKNFTQRDKDLFLKKAFATIKSYFQEALSQLEAQYPEIETDLTEVHNLKIICKIYVNGEARCQSKIWIGGIGIGSSNLIGYSEGRISDRDDSYNEMIAVEDDGFDLYLKFLMGFHLVRSQGERFSPEKAAEELWKRFSSPLER